MNRILVSNAKMYLVFVIATVMIATIFSSYISAYGSELNIPNVINIFDKEVDASIYLKNNTTSEKVYSLKVHTSPFLSELQEDSFTLSPSESKTLKLTIKPIQNTLKTEYKASIELISGSTRSVHPFTITQYENKICELEVNKEISYNSNIDKYLLNLNIKNNTNIQQEIILKQLINAENFKERSLVIDSNSEEQVNYLVTTKENTLTLEYICNQISIKEDIDVPKKIKDGINLSGYFSFISISSILNSLAFQIILVLVLIILILSFATRYIKYLYSKQK